MINKLHIGNLAYAVTDDTLKSAFEAFGAVQSAVVVKDRNSGKSKGFGFVEMVSEDDAARAIEKLNNTPLEGRVILVSEAKSTGPFDPSNAADSRHSSRPRGRKPFSGRGFRKDNGNRSFNKNNHRKDFSEKVPSAS